MSNIFVKKQIGTKKIVRPVTSSGWDEKEKEYRAAGWTPATKKEAADNGYVEADTKEKMTNQQKTKTKK